MLRLFRKIRQRFFINKKFSQYLLYAIGEIVLIVLGIMIALQLDNYNEQKKQEAEMVQSLKELKLELESNISRSHGILQFYSNRDSLIRQHLCHSISREDVINDIGTHWDLGTMRFTLALDREVMDKILLNLENLPDELEHFKSGLRWLDGAYEEMEGNNTRLLEITDAEGDYRARNNSWNHEMWRWDDRPFDEDLKKQVLDYILDNSHYQNHLHQIWSLVARNTVPDILRLRQVMISHLEIISDFLDSTGQHTFQLPDEFRYDLSEVTGTYRVWSKPLGDGQDNVELGEYILFEEEGRLMTYTRFDPKLQKNIQSDQKVEWVALGPKTVISPSAWFMHLVQGDTTGSALEYAGCNNRNLYFTKID